MVTNWLLVKFDEWQVKFEDRLVQFYEKVDSWLFCVYLKLHEKHEIRVLIEGLRPQIQTFVCIWGLSLTSGVARGQGQPLRVPVVREHQRGAKKYKKWALGTKNPCYTTVGPGRQISSLLHWVWQGEQVQVPDTFREDLYLMAYGSPELQNFFSSFQVVDGTFLCDLETELLGILEWSLKAGRDDNVNTLNNNITWTSRYSCACACVKNEPRFQL